MNIWSTPSSYGTAFTHPLICNFAVGCFEACWLGDWRALFLFRRSNSRGGTCSPADSGVDYSLFGKRRFYLFNLSEPSAILYTAIVISATQPPAPPATCWCV